MQSCLQFASGPSGPVCVCSTRGTACRRCAPCFGLGPLSRPLAATQRQGPHLRTACSGTLPPSLPLSWRTGLGSFKETSGSPLLSPPDLRQGPGPSLQHWRLAHGAPPQLAQTSRVRRPVLVSISSLRQTAPASHQLFQVFVGPSVDLGQGAHFNPGRRHCSVLESLLDIALAPPPSPSGYIIQFLPLHPSLPSLSLLPCLFHLHCYLSFCPCKIK